MIVVLHGENQLASRKALDEYRSRYDQVTVLDGKTVGLTDLTQNLSSNQLFPEKSLVVLENYLGNKKVLEPEKVAVDLVLWESNTISPSALKGLTAQEFKIDSLVFRFCDSLGLGNNKIPYELFSRCLENEDVEFVFLMMVRQFRLMLCPEMASDWQRGKVLAQFKLIGAEKVSFGHNKLLEIDYRNKMGLLLGGLRPNLERLVLWI